MSDAADRNLFLFLMGSMLKALPHKAGQEFFENEVGKLPTTEREELLLKLSEIEAEVKRVDVGETLN